MYNYIFSRVMNIETIRRQTIMSLIFQIIITFVGFFGTMYFARTVGADILGAYFLFMSYFGIIGMFSEGGLGGATNKRISEGVEQNEYFSASFVLKTISITAIIILLLYFRDSFQDLNNSGIFIWLLIILIVSLLQGTISTGLTGCGKMGIASIGNFIQSISQVIFQVIAIFLGYNSVGLVGGFVAGMLISSLIQLHFLDLQFVRFGWKHVKSLLSFSFWGVLILGGSLVFIYSDTIMIGYFMKNSDVGIYRLIFQFTSLMIFTTYAITTTLFIRISLWDKSKDTELIKKSFSKALTYSFILATPMLVGGIIMGDKLLYYLYGSEFNNYLVLIVLLFVQVVSIFNILLKTYLTAMNQIKELFGIIVITASANIILNFLLIPSVGIIGAAISTLFTMIISVILANNILMKKIKLELEYKSLINIIKSTAIMGIFVVCFRLIIPIENVLMTIVPIFIFGLLYFFLVFKLDKQIYDEIKDIIVSTHEQKT